MLKLILSLTLSLVTLFAFAQKNFVGTVTYTFELSDAMKNNWEDGPIPTTKVFSYHNGNYRVQTYGGKEIIEDIIVNASTGKVYSIVAAEKTAYVQTLDNSDNGKIGANSFSVKGKTPVKIAGYNCHEYEVIERDYEFGVSPFTHKVWTAKEFKPYAVGDFQILALLMPFANDVEGLPLKVEMVDNSGVGIRFAIVATKVDLNKPDANLFLPPSGYAIKPYVAAE